MTNSTKRTRERNVTLGISNNAVFLHLLKTNHIFNFNVAIMLAHIHNK